MTPPATIRVGPYSYAVEMRADDSGSSVWARIRYKERTLRVDPAMSTQMQRAALLHELLHAVNDLGGFSEDKYWPKDDERYSTTVAPLWLMVLQANPDLVAFLVAAE